MLVKLLMVLLPIEESKEFIMYFRYHTSYYSPKTGEAVGLFVAVWHLVENNILTAEEIEEYWKQRKKSEIVLPVPPFYSDGNSIKAITWFKETNKVNELLKEIDFYFQMLKKYNVDLCIVRSDSPGRIIYEDDFQIGVIKDDI